MALTKIVQAACRSLWLGTEGSASVPVPSPPNKKVLQPWHMLPEPPAPTHHYLLCLGLQWQPRHRVPTAGLSRSQGLSMASHESFISPPGILAGTHSLLSCDSRCWSTSVPCSPTLALHCGPEGMGCVRPTHSRRADVTTQLQPVSHHCPPPTMS